MAATVLLRVNGTPQPVRLGDNVTLAARYATAAAAEAESAELSADAAAESALDLQDLTYGDVGTIARELDEAFAGTSTYSLYTTAIARPVLVDCEVVSFSFVAGPGVSAIALKVFRLVGGDWTQVGSDVDLVASPSTTNTYRVSNGDMPAIPMERGDIFGWYVTGGTVTYDAASTAAADPALYSATAVNDDALVATVVYNAKFNMKVGLRPVEVVDRDDIDNISESLIQMTDAATQVIGPSGTLVTGGAVSDITIIHQSYALGDGVVSEVRAFALTAGSLKVRVMEIISGVMMPAGDVYEFTMVLGANAFAAAIPIKEGQYLAFYAGTRVSTITPGTPIYYKTGGDFLTREGGAIGLTSFNSTVQVAFDIDYREFVGAKLRVLSQAEYDALAEYDARTIYAITA